MTEDVYIYNESVVVTFCVNIRLLGLQACFCFPMDNN